MKFLPTTVRKFLTIIAYIALISGLQAQDGINVPNSVFGLGDPLGAGFTVSRMMAGANTAVVQADNINVLNPAANAYLGSPVFDVALQSRNYRYNSPAFSGTQTNTSIRHFAIGFAKGKRFGMSFSLNPFTRVEYSVKEQGEIPDIGTFSNTYVGSGGINRFTANAAYKIYTDSLSSLSLGLGGQYYFGFIERSSFTEIANASTFNALTADNILLGDFGAQAGLIYRRKLNTKLVINLGASYEYAGNVRTSRELTSLRYTGQFEGSNAFILDTILNSVDTGATVIPSSQRAGLSFEVNRKWVFSLNYEQVNWAGLEIFGQNQNLANRVMFAFGAEFWPDFRASNDLFEFMRYRAGVRYGQSHITDNGNPVDEFGISLGLSIPMIKSGSLSSLNIGWEFAQRELPSSSLTETISRINVGVIMTPNKFDRWFFRRKID